MSLNIKDPEAHRLAQAIAEATGESMTRVVVGALRERYARLEQTRRKASVKGLLAISRRTAALAKATGEPLLFKGGDFSQTDIPVAGQIEAGR